MKNNLTETVVWPGASAPAAENDSVDLAVLRGFEEDQCEGEPDFVVELIDLYLQDAPAKLRELRIALACGDLETLGREAHSLKGGSASLGARRMAVVSEELELAAAGDATRDGLAILNDLEGEYGRVVAALEAERWQRVGA